MGERDLGVGGCPRQRSCSLNAPGQVEGEGCIAARRAAGLAELSLKKRPLLQASPPLSFLCSCEKQCLGVGRGWGVLALQVPAPLALTVNTEFWHLLCSDGQCSPRSTNTHLLVHVPLCLGCSWEVPHVGVFWPMVWSSPPLLFCQHWSWQRAALQTKGQRRPACSPLPHPLGSLPSPTLHPVLKLPPRA